MISLRDIDEAAALAARITAFMRRGEDMADRFHIARCGIVIELASVNHTRHRRDLVSAGLRAIDKEHKAWSRTWGYNPGTQCAMPAFWRYWHIESSPVASPEVAVVERTALAQIWERMSKNHQDTIQALAACNNDYRQAAAILGVDLGLFRGRVRHARSQFLSLWHEGERPSQVWRRSDPGRRSDVCVKGHDLSGENLGWAGRQGSRKKVCRACARDASRRWRLRLREQEGQREQLRKFASLRVRLPRAARPGT